MEVLTMGNIGTNNKQADNRNYVVAINEDGQTRIFCDRTDESILEERCSIIWRGKSYKKAENAEKAYRNRNTAFCVIAVYVDGALVKLKLVKHVGVMYNAPIGMVGFFKSRRAAKRFMNEYRSAEKQKEKTSA